LESPKFSSTEVFCYELRQFGFSQIEADREDRQICFVEDLDPKGFISRLGAEFRD
jgi:hypothetical protein